MKTVNHKILSFALLALMFAVAVSGGCGGGSSGHYYGDYGQDRNSSNDVTPESQDVIPENPVSGDDYDDEDYGVNNNNDPLYKFKWLDKSVWGGPYEIEVYSRPKNGSMAVKQCEPKLPSSNYSADKITLSIKNSSMVWTDGKNNEHQVNDDLTIKIIDPDDNSEQRVILLRAHDLFKLSPGAEATGNSDFRAYIQRNDLTGNVDTEEINIIRTVGPSSILADKLRIINSCQGSDGQEYTSFFTLERHDLDTWNNNGHNLYTETFETLNETEWTIKSVDVVGPNGKSRSIKKNTYNYDVSQITLLTNSSNRNGNVSGGFTWIDGKNHAPNRNKPLTINFSGGIFTTYTAPLLTPAIGFKYKGKDADGTLEFQTTLSNGNTETIFQHNWGRNDWARREQFVKISHSFTINNQQYTANMLLVPAN